MLIIATNFIQTAYNLVDMIWIGTATALLVFFSKEIFSIFLNEREALNMGINYLKIIGYSQVFMCIEIISSFF